MSVPRLIERIHASPHQVVVEFAGAGVQALAWLHSVAGSSRTILEATDRYAAASLVELIGFQPERFTSRQVSTAMAAAAYQRAQILAEAGPPLIGLGCTATIATDRQKRGEHRCFVSAYTPQQLLTFELTLAKGLRQRHQEEELVSRLLLRVLAEACELDSQVDLRLTGDERLLALRQPAHLAADLLAGQVETVTVWPDGRLTPDQRLEHIALVSGSFNPLHQGHRCMAKLAASKLDYPVYFELPLLNADKAIIQPAEAWRRAAQFADVAPLVLSPAPLFSRKAELYPYSIFVVGFDTAARIVDPRFYEHDPAKMRLALADIQRSGCRFLVVGRVTDRRFMTVADLHLPADFASLFEGVSETEFRIDLSSTELRSQQLGEKSSG